MSTTVTTANFRCILTTKVKCVGRPSPISLGVKLKLDKRQNQRVSWVHERDNVSNKYYKQTRDNGSTSQTIKYIFDKTCAPVASILPRETERITPIQEVYSWWDLNQMNAKREWEWAENKNVIYENQWVYVM